MSFLTGVLVVLILLMLLGIVLTVFDLHGMPMIALVVIIPALLSGFRLVGIGAMLVAIVGAVIAEGIGLATRKNPYLILINGASIRAALIGSVVFICLLTPIIYGIGIVLGVFLGSLTGLFYGELVRQKNATHFTMVKKSIMFREFGCMIARGLISVVVVVVVIASLHS